MIENERRYALFCDGMPEESCEEYFDLDGFSDDPYQHDSAYAARAYAPKHGWEVKGTDNRDKDLCPKCIEERDRTKTEQRTGTRYPENGGIKPGSGEALTLEFTCQCVCHEPLSRMDPHPNEKCRCNGGKGYDAL